MTQNDSSFSPHTGSAVAGFLSPGCTGSGDEPYLTESERELQRILNEHPSVKARIAFLINGYRSLVTLSMEVMRREGIDMADIQIACAKKDAELISLGIPILETHDDWMRVREQV